MEIGPCGAIGCPPSETRRRADRASLARDTRCCGGRWRAESGLLIPSSESPALVPPGTAETGGLPAAVRPLLALLGLVDAQAPSVHLLLPAAPEPWASAGSCRFASKGGALARPLSSGRGPAGSTGQLLPSGEVAMKSLSTPLGRVAGQVKGPFVPARADVIPGSHSALGGHLQPWPPACLPTCCPGPVLFAMWGGLREGPAVGGDTVFVLPSESRDTQGRAAGWLQAQPPSMPPPSGTAVGR